jgi:hypothetical protein
MKFLFNLLFILFFIFKITTLFSFSKSVRGDKIISYTTQDNTILIQKIKAKIKALKKQKQKLKILKKWNSKKEKQFLFKLLKLNNSLEMLGKEPSKELDSAAIIKKLQKKLKVLYNNRVDKKSFNSWTIKDDSILKIKAGKLLLRIVELRKENN